MFGLLTVLVCVSDVTSLICNTMQYYILTL